MRIRLLIPPFILVIREIRGQPRPLLRSPPPLRVEPSTYTLETINREGLSPCEQRERFHRRTAAAVFPEVAPPVVVPERVPAPVR